MKDIISKKRKELGLNQQELADKLFVSDKVISKWETGKSVPETSLFWISTRYYSLELAGIKYLIEENTTWIDDLKKVVAEEPIVRGLLFSITFMFIGEN